MWREHLEKDFLQKATSGEIIRSMARERHSSIETNSVNATPKVLKMPNSTQTNLGWDDYLTQLSSYSSLPPARCTLGP